VALLLIGFLAAASPAWAAQHVAAPSIEQLTRAADVVAIGEVAAATGEWAPGRATIQTRVVLTIVELLKGAEPSPLTFTHLGGRVGGEASAMGGGPQFQPGERVVVFLSRRQDGSLRLRDLSYGRFEIVRDAATGRDHAILPAGATGADRTDLDQLRMLARRALGGTD
jgi:hypothetical protein